MLKVQCYGERPFGGQIGPVAVTCSLQSQLTGLPAACAAQTWQFGNRKNNFSEPFLHKERMAPTPEEAPVVPLSDPYRCLFLSIPHLVSCLSCLLDTCTFLNRHFVNIHQTPFLSAAQLME